MMVSREATSQKTTNKLLFTHSKPCPKETAAQVDIRYKLIYRFTHYSLFANFLQAAEEAFADRGIRKGSEMQYQSIKTPSWTNAELEVDVTDIWVEECDPENENGEEVIAYLSTNTSGFITVDGISLDDGVTKIYRSREWTEKMIGFDAINRIEESEQEAA